MEDKYKHSDLLYDYIKFHLGLYISTPPILAIIASALHVEECLSFQLAMVFLILIYFVAGVHASRMLANFINVKWSDTNNWEKLGELSSDRSRRFFQHHLYWVGLLIGLIGIALAKYYQ